MSTSWYIDPEVLIVEVKPRPLLYATTLPDYANKSLKNEAWEELAKKLSENWETLSNAEKKTRCKDIQVKWKNVRDNFRREYQAQKDVTPGPGGRKKKKYRYYDQLLFLIPYVKDTSTSGNHKTPRNNSDSQPSAPLNIENSSIAQPIASPKLQSTPMIKKKKTSFEENISKPLRNETTVPDEDVSFCLSLVQSLKKMDDDNKMSAKIEILNIIRTFSTKPLDTHQHHSQPIYIYTQNSHHQHSQFNPIVSPSSSSSAIPSPKYRIPSSPEESYISPDNN